MIKETNLLDIKDFQDKNNANIEIASDTIYRLVLDSITCEKIESLEKSLKSLSENFEVIGNLINLTNENNEVCYNFGKIAAITEIALDLIKYEKLSFSLEQIAKSYPLLLPALEAIMQRNIISGVELQKKLNLKSSSNLTNFAKRIDKYELINIRKIGTTNYFSLTRKGEQLLSQNKKTTTFINANQIPLKHVYVMLEEMSEEIGKANPNAIKVIHAVSDTLDIKEKRLLKHKIDVVFHASEKLKLSRIRKLISPKTNCIGEMGFRDATLFSATYESRKYVLEGNYV